LLAHVLGGLGELRELEQADGPQLRERVRQLFQVSGDQRDGVGALAEAQGGLDGEVEGDGVIGRELEGFAVAGERLGVVAGLLLGALAVLDPGGCAQRDGALAVVGLFGEAVELVGEVGDGGAVLGAAAHGGAARGEQGLAGAALPELLQVDSTCLSGHGHTDSFTVAVVVGRIMGGPCLGEQRVGVLAPALGAAQRGQGEGVRVEALFDREQVVGEVEEGGRGDLRRCGIGGGGAQLERAAALLEQGRRLAADASQGAVAGAADDRRCGELGPGAHVGSSSTSVSSSSSSTW
jgi:hypothetical protein